MTFVKGIRERFMQCYSVYHDVMSIVEATSAQVVLICKMWSVSKFFLLEFHKKNHKKCQLTFFWCSHDSLAQKSFEPDMMDRNPGQLHFSIVLNGAKFSAHFVSSFLLGSDIHRKINLSYICTGRICFKEKSDSTLKSSHAKLKKIVLKLLGMF